LVWSVFVFKNSTDKVPSLVTFELLGLQLVGCNWQWKSAFFRINKTHSSWFPKRTRVLMSLSIMQIKGKKSFLGKWIHIQLKKRSIERWKRMIFRNFKAFWRSKGKYCFDWLVPNINNIWLHPNMAQNITRHTRNHLLEILAEKIGDFFLYNGYMDSYMYI